MSAPGPWRPAVGAGLARTLGSAVASRAPRSATQFVALSFTLNSMQRSVFRCTAEHEQRIERPRFPQGKPSRRRRSRQEAFAGANCRRRTVWKRQNAKSPSRRNVQNSEADFSRSPRLDNLPHQPKTMAKCFRLSEQLQKCKILKRRCLTRRSSRPPTA